MRRFTGILGLGALWLGFAYLPVFSGDTDKKVPEKTDITAEVRRLNADGSQMPPQEFRKGHVTPRPFDAASIKKTELGFEIQLPSKAPVPTPTVYKGKVYVSGGFHSKEYYCFDAVTGKLVWAVNLDDDGPTSAVCADGVCIFNTESCTIFALDADTGKQLWSYWLGDPLTSTPTIANGKVFTSYPIGARNGGGLKDGPGQGANKKAGAAATPKMPEASHVFACLELKTGAILWQRWIDSDVMSASVAVGDDVFATSFAGTVYKFKQADGLVLSAHRSRATSAPVIVAGNVYLTQRADNGKDGKTEERIAAVDKQGEARPGFAGFHRPAEYLDGKVQDRSAAKKARCNGGRRQWVGRIASGCGQCPRRLQERRPGQYLHHASFPGLAHPELRGQQLQLHGQRSIVYRPGRRQSPLERQAGRQPGKGRRLFGFGARRRRRQNLPGHHSGRAFADRSRLRQYRGPLQDRLSRARPTRHRRWPGLCRHDGRQARLHRHGPPRVHRLEHLGRQRGPHEPGGETTLGGRLSEVMAFSCPVDRNPALPVH